MRFFESGPSHPSAPDDEVRWTRLEVAFTVGIVGCLLFATWQLGDLLVRDWLAGWVGESALREDLVYYGVAFTAALAALGGTTRSLVHTGRFRRTVGRSLLWYGALLLISASGMGAIEYLPEVAAGLFGAGVLIAAVYVLQRRYFTRERVRQRRLRNDNCPGVGVTSVRGRTTARSAGVAWGRTVPNAGATCAAPTSTARPADGSARARSRSCTGLRARAPNPFA